MKSFLMGMAIIPVLLVYAESQAEEFSETTDTPRSAIQCIQTINFGETRDEPYVIIGKDAWNRSGIYLFGLFGDRVGFCPLPDNRGNWPEGIMIDNDTVFSTLMRSQLNIRIIHSHDGQGTSFSMSSSLDENNSRYMRERLTKIRMDEGEAASTLAAQAYAEMKNLQKLLPGLKTKNTPGRTKTCESIHRSLEACRGLQNMGGLKLGELRSKIENAITTQCPSTGSIGVTSAR